MNEYRDKLRERIARLIEGRSAEIEPSRLEQEVVLIADRSDMAEETTRLLSHCDQFGEIMQSAASPVGRQLDFLLQEMSREANTIGSKSLDISITRLVVEIKAELERIREQVQNVL
jgi:uncharacterized protein (TIGR00255 family)